VRLLISKFAPVAVLGSGLALAACSSVENFLAGDKIDYKSQSTKVATLEVPPDLSQLNRDSRYQPVGGVVSASALQATAAAAATSAGQGVAPAAIGETRIERQGNQRWLVTKLTPEQLWPQITAFWRERGFTLAVESIDTGVIETDWAENRGKLPMDFVRRTLGWLLDPLYSTGERDRFRTRIERGADSTEVFISHRGMEEVVQGALKETTIWRGRPSDPQLEAEMLARLMVKLGARDEGARAQLASAPEQAARARLLGAAAGTAFEIDERFDRAWRRVGLALDRSGFTVEDRDRAAGWYFVRYSDPKLADKAEPGFFAKMFSSDTAAKDALKKYRVAVKAAGDKTEVAVQDAQGAADTTEVAKRIASLLVDELK
jgi:outer membrane protein assembly factor BamC